MINTQDLFKWLCTDSRTFEQKRRDARRDMISNVFWGSVLSLVVLDGPVIGILIYLGVV